MTDCDWTIEASVEISASKSLKQLTVSAFTIADVLQVRKGLSLNIRFDNDTFDIEDHPDYTECVYDWVQVRKHEMKCMTVVKQLSDRKVRCGD